MKIGQLIRELRTKRGITQADLAAKTEISIRTIQRIENGEVDPRAYTLQSIAEALEVDFEIFADSWPELDIAKEKEDAKWLPMLHLSGILFLIIPPILIWIWKRDQNEGIRRHAIDVINFQLSLSLYILPFLIFFAPPIVIMMTIFGLIVVIVNTVKVLSHQPYKYPLNIRFLKHHAP